MDNLILSEILKTHPNLKEEDVVYGNILLDIYGFDHRLLVRLIPIIYFDCNNEIVKIDNMIKSRNISKMPEWGNIISESIAVIALKNMIEYMKVENYGGGNLFSQNGLYMRFLKDSSYDANYNFENYSKVSLDKCGLEYGKFIKINKLKGNIKK